MAPGSVRWVGNINEECWSIAAEQRREKASPGSPPERCGTQFLTSPKRNSSNSRSQNKIKRNASGTRRAVYYQLHSFPSSQAAAAVEKETIEPMVPKPPNSNAVQMIRVFMAVLQLSVITTIRAAMGT